MWTTRGKNPVKLGFEKFSGILILWETFKMLNRHQKLKAQAGDNCSKLPLLYSTQGTRTAHKYSTSQLHLQPLPS